MTSIRPSPISARRLALGRAGARLANHYGPTEATIFATEWSCTLGDVGPVPIGRPVAGVRAYVLSDRLEPLPAGVAGELYLGGAGVAQGYVGAPGLTASAFPPDPFCEVAGARMYRTGDLARRREDGALDFLGRADDQVQLRGYRIELGEIEAVLLSHPAVRAAAVTQRPGRTGEPLLAAYVEGDGPVTADQLRAHLACHLPDYMLPGQLQLLDSMPRTVTGKVDRSRLPERASRIVAVPPRDAREQAVAAIWAHVLGLTDIAAFDDFFALGGDSLLATRVARRIRREFGIDMPILAVFEHTTVAALAAEVARARGRA